MTTEWHFPIMIAASVIEFIGVLRLMVGREVFHRQLVAVAVVAVVVVAPGMWFGRYGATAGLPWWIYYPVPALVTLVLPPVVFRPNRRRFALYVVLAALSAPLLHVAFTYLLGWGEYMPFLHLPSLVSPR
jgi:hypothetical protein